MDFWVYASATECLVNARVGNPASKGFQIQIQYPGTSEKNYFISKILLTKGFTIFKIQNLIYSWISLRVRLYPTVGKMLLNCRFKQIFFANSRKLVV